MTNISLGQTIDGSLSSTDTKNPKKLGSFSDDYTLTGISNWQQVQVNMDSTAAIDSYLQLINVSTGEVIAFNDDLINGGKNSQLSFTVVPGVNYAIRATSLNANETGNYTFKTSSLGTASSLVVTKYGQKAGTVDPLGRFVQIGSFVDAGSSSEFADIAFSNDNKLLGIKNDALPTQLYGIDLGSGSSSKIGNFPSNVEMGALAFSPNATLYGASRSNSSNSSKLYTVNPQNGTASSIADFSWEAKSGGDLVFDPVNNRFLFAKSSAFTTISTLFSVSLTGQSTKIGDIGFDLVSGLSFEGSTLVGFTEDKMRIKIDPATGKGTFDRNITGLSSSDAIFGAGSIPSATLTPTPTPPTPTPTATPLTIGLGETINESLSSTDTKNPKKLGSFSDDYTLTGISNWQQVQVNMDSTAAIDSYLQLINASTGEVIAFNDDLINGGKNSQLSFTVVPGANYAIRATSLNANETGNYTFKTSSLGTASSLVSTDSGQVGSVDSAGKFVKIATSPSLNDIALSSDNKLFGITNSQLYSVDPVSGSSSPIGNLGASVDIVGLAFSPSNVLYATGGSNLYTINQTTGAASLVANLGSNFDASGDLLFDPVSNRFLATSGVNSDNSLFSISLTGQATKIGNIGFSKVYGLSSKDGNLFGFTGANQRIVINPATGVGTLDQNVTGVSGVIFGATSIVTATPTPTPTPPTPTPTPALTPTPTPTPALTPTPTPTRTPTPTPTLTPTPTPTPALTPTPTPTRTPTPTPTLTPTPTPTPTLTTPTPTPTRTPTPTPTLTPTPTPTPALTPTPTPTVPPVQEKLPNTVTADFVDSDTDKILKDSVKNLASNIDNSKKNPIVAFVANNSSDKDVLNKALRDLDISSQDLNRLDDFKYGEWQQGIKKAEQKNTREVKIRELSESPQPQNTWVLIHGLNDNSDRFLDLEKAIKAAKPNDRVLLLDWSDASSNGTLPKDNGDAIYATARLGNYFAAKWATPVAEWAVKKLEQDYGIDGKVASENLKIIGHSLGSLVSSEMGRIYTLGKNRKGDNVLPNANGLNTLIALDPPSQLNIDIYSDYTASYDLDGRTAKADRPEFFQDIARNSLAFVGAKSIAGNQRLAAGALNSFQMDFGNIIDSGEEHVAVIKTFTELIKEKGEIGNRILNSQTFNARQNTLIYNSEDAKNGLAHEGVLSVKKPNEPIQLIVNNAKTSGNNDLIVYGTPNDNGLIGGLDNDNILAGDAGTDTLYGLTGNDTLYGDQGNDTIYGGKDNDILLGGEGNDFLSGDLDDDTLIGGKGKDTLTGGFGSDTFVFSSGDGASRIDDADIITDFGTGGFLGFGGADKIGLADGLKANMIDVEPLNNGAQTVLKAKVNGITEYLAVLNGNFSRNDLKLQENFVIPTIS
ncbi:MAG: hypothetical protein ACBR50_11725 [Microcoleus sp.]